MVRVNVKIIIKEYKVVNETKNNTKKAEYCKVVFLSMRFIYAHYTSKAPVV